MEKRERRSLKDDIHHRNIHDRYLEQHREQYRTDKKGIREQGNLLPEPDHGDSHHLKHHDRGEGNRTPHYGPLGEEAVKEKEDPRCHEQGNSNNSHSHVFGDTCPYFGR
jgi:hypothetical protein